MIYYIVIKFLTTSATNNPNNLVISKANKKQGERKNST